MTPENRAKLVKTKINLLILIGCYIFVILGYVLNKELFYTPIPIANNTTAGITAILTLITAPAALMLYILLSSAVALPLFGIWLLLQKFTFKNFPYTEQTFRKIRKALIVISAALLAVLIIQATQY